MLRITLLSAFWSNESHKPLVEHAIAKWHCMEWWSGHLPWNQTSAAVSACRERLYQACWMLTHQVSCLGKHCSLCHWVSRYDEKEHNFACSLPCHGHIKQFKTVLLLGCAFCIFLLWAPVTELLKTESSEFCWFSQKTETGSKSTDSKASMKVEEMKK